MKIFSEYNNNQEENFEFFKDIFNFGDDLENEEEINVKNEYKKQQPKEYNLFISLEESQKGTKKKYINTYIKNL